MGCSLSGITEMKNNQEMSARRKALADEILANIILEEDRKLMSIFETLINHRADEMKARGIIHVWETEEVDS